MQRYFYSATIAAFNASTEEQILGEIASNNLFDLEMAQTNAWKEEITILKSALLNRQGSVYFEYSIPRMGKRVDVVLVIGPVVFVLEFKTGESKLTMAALDQ